MSHNAEKQKKQDGAKGEQEEDESWKDTNVGLIGSDLDKSVKKKAAETEPAWEGAGEKPGVQVWRINKFAVESVPVEQYGEFFVGDSYIVLHTYKNKSTEALEYNLFFWIGKDSTQDEYGTAAYKTVELDAYLDDKPVQYREVYSNESKKFKACFPDRPISYHKGGYDSGFRKVAATVFESKMYKIKEMKNNPNVFCLVEVEMKWSKIYSDSVVLIVTNDHLFQFNGPDAPHRHKYGMCQILKTLDIMKFRPQTKVDTEEFTSYQDIEDTFEKFPKYRELLGSAKAPEDLKLELKKRGTQETADEFEITLFRYKDKTDMDGEDWDVVARGSRIQKLDTLEPNCLYLLDLNTSVVLYDQRTRECRKESAMVCGQHYLDLKSTKEQKRASMSCIKSEEVFLDQCRSK